MTGGGRLDEINVSLFSGIVAKGLSVKEKDGQRDFLKIGRFVLSYKLLPLLKKQLVISKIEIVSPSISVKKERGGEYNFSDMMGKTSQEPQKPSGPEHPSEHKSLPVSVIADRLVIRDPVFEFLLERNERIAGRFACSGCRIQRIPGKGWYPSMDFGVISIKKIGAKLKDREIKVSGKIDMDAKTLRANLQTLIGKG